MMVCEIWRNLVVEKAQLSLNIIGLFLRPKRIILTEAAIHLHSFQWHLWYDTVVRECRWKKLGKEWSIECCIATCEVASHVWHDNFCVLCCIMYWAGGAINYGLDGQSWSWARTRDFSLLHSVQSGSGGPPSLLSNGYLGLLPRG
jgi:hypothetical protein